MKSNMYMSFGKSFNLFLISPTNIADVEIAESM